MPGKSVSRAPRAERRHPECSPGPPNRWRKGRNICPKSARNRLDFIDAQSVDGVVQFGNITRFSTTNRTCILFQKSTSRAFRRNVMFPRAIRQRVIDHTNTTGARLFPEWKAHIRPIRFVHIVPTSRFSRHGAKHKDTSRFPPHPRPSLILYRPKVKARRQPLWADAAPQSQEFTVY